MSVGLPGVESARRLRTDCGQAHSGSIRIGAAEFAVDLATPATDAFATEMDFRVDLETYRGPLDLLLYLVKKHEVDIMDIPISTITTQYLEYLEILEQLHIDEVGDFIELASLLIEAKSRLVLPREQEEQEAEPVDDPREELVQRLLEYKQYKDAASILNESSRDWQQRYPRVSNDLPTRRVDPADQPIKELELWDLVSAIGRIMRDADRLKPLTNIVYDDTPISVYMQKMHEELLKTGELSVSSMYLPGMNKANLIGIFLAVLELARNYGVTVEQAGVHGQMVLRPGERFVPQMEITEVFGEFGETEAVEEGIPAKPR